jgi:hypothetical protein
VETNLTLGDVRALSGLIKDVGPDNVRTATLPAAPVTIHGVSYLEPDWLAARRIVDDVVLGNSPVIEVVNASSVPGAGFDVADKLEAAGFQVRHVFQGEQQRRDCSIVDHYGRLDRAQDVERVLGVARIFTQRLEEGIDFTVVVGEEYVENSQNNAAPQR